MVNLTQEPLALENDDSNTDAPSGQKSPSPALMPEKEYMDYPAFKELAARPQWVNWSPAPRTNSDGITKIAKPPYRPGSDSKASTHDPVTWGTYQDALRAVESGQHTGIGFVFSEDDPYVGIDLDTCRNPETGLIKTWALRIIDRFGSYTEVSPSGTGVHIYAKGTLKGAARRRQAGEKMKVEAYPSRQYFTFTGEHLQNTPTTIEERQEQLDDLARWLNSPAAATPRKPPSPAAAPNGRKNTGGGVWRPPVHYSDEEILSWAQRKVTENKSRYPSDSEVEQALCYFVVVGTKGDTVRADRLVRDSNQLRKEGRAENWDRKIGETTYGQLTMQKALKWYLLDPRTITEEAQKPPSRSHAVRVAGRSEGTERGR